jgi:hypothetical protein
MIPFGIRYLPISDILYVIKKSLEIIHNLVLNPFRYKNFSQISSESVNAVVENSHRSNTLQITVTMQGMLNMFPQLVQFSGCSVAFFCNWLVQGMLWDWDL